MNKRWMAMLLLAASTTACAKAAPVQETPTKTESTAAAVASQVVAVSNTITTDKVKYESDDAYSDWKQANPTYIELKGDSASITGPGAAMSGKTVMIAQAGVFVLSGKLTDSQIVVDSQNKVYVKKADKAVITLQEGTQDLVSDAKSHATGESEPNAVIYSEADLVINGTGSLTVRGEYDNGIQSKDDLKSWAAKSRSRPRMTAWWAGTWWL